MKIVLFTIKWAKIILLLVDFCLLGLCYSKYVCNVARYWLQAPWGWHDSVETCRSVIVCEIIVHLLGIVQNKKKTFYYRFFLSIFRCTIAFDKTNWCLFMKLSDHPSVGFPKFTPPQHLSHFFRHSKVSGSRTCTQFPHNFIYGQGKLLLKLQYGRKKIKQKYEGHFSFQTFPCLAFLHYTVPAH